MQAQHADQLNCDAIHVQFNELKSTPLNLIRPACIKPDLACHILVAFSQQRSCYPVYKQALDDSDDAKKFYAIQS
jgi:hypothetical protein